MNAGFDTSLRSYSTGVHPEIKQPVLQLKMLNYSYILIALVLWFDTQNINRKAQELRALHPNCVIYEFFS